MNVANASYIVYRVMFRDYVAKQIESGLFPIRSQSYVLEVLVRLCSNFGG